MTEQYWPAESLEEFKARLDLPEPERHDYYALVKDIRYPPGDPRRYGADGDAPKQGEKP
jgi:hypothetical protein